MLQIVISGNTSYIYVQPKGLRHEKSWSGACENHQRKLCFKYLMFFELRSSTDHHSMIELHIFLKRLKLRENTISFFFSKLSSASNKLAVGKRLKYRNQKRKSSDTVLKKFVWLCTCHATELWTM